MRHCITLSVLLLYAAVASGGDIQRATVRHSKGVYFLELEVELQAAFEPVYQIVTDYERLYRISDVLLESTLLSEPGAPVPRRRLVTRVCVLVFCFSATMVEDVVEQDNTIITRIVPAESDYQSGKTLWRVAALDATRSSIQLYSELEPGFWIPPFIGPYLMKQKMMSEAKKSIDRIEELASDG